MNLPYLPFFFLCDDMPELGQCPLCKYVGTLPHDTPDSLVVRCPKCYKLVKPLYTKKGLENYLSYALV